MDGRRAPQLYYADSIEKYQVSHLMKYLTFFFLFWETIDLEGGLKYLVILFFERRYRRQDRAFGF